MQATVVTRDLSISVMDLMTFSGGDVAGEHVDVNPHEAEEKPRRTNQREDVAAGVAGGDGGLAFSLGDERAHCEQIEEDSDMRCDHENGESSALGERGLVERREEAKQCRPLMRVLPA